MNRRLTVTKFDPARLPLEESLFHTANGYLGVRANFEEGCPEEYGASRGAYINGFYDTHAIDHPEKLYGFPEVGERILNLTDVQGISLRVSGEPMMLRPDRVSDYERGLDMDAGEAFRSFEYTAKNGGRIRLAARRLASFRRPEVFAIRFEVTAAAALELEIESTVLGRVSNSCDPSDPRVSSREFRSLTAVHTRLSGLRAEMESRTAGTGFHLNVQVDHSLDRSGELLAPTRSRDDDGEIALAWTIFLDKGETVVLEKIAVYRDSLRRPDPEKRRADFWPGGVPAYRELAEEQKTFTAAFWDRAGIEINGDEEATRALCLNMYHLLQSGPRTEAAGIPAKGLSGEGYEGHSFWDTEIYMFPFFLHTAPETAKNLLLRRHQCLPMAREQARLLGHRRGAAFPWRTISGRECSAFYPSGCAQYHINADIAYAVGEYWQATDDDRFMAEAGAELLFEIARIWTEVGNFDAKGVFHINTVTGPDEYTCLVSDNYYTNRMAAHGLRLASKAASRLRDRHPEALRDLSSRIGLDAGEPEEWLRTAKAMHLPYSRELDLTPQDESFFAKPLWDFDGTPEDNYPLLLHYHPMTLSRYQVCKQADAVLAYILLNPPEKESTLRRSFAYYEKVTVHDSSLSYSAFSVMAAGLGDPEKARDYFRRAVTLDLDDSHGNASDGIHAANMGGSWMAAVWGFGGFLILNGAPSFSPSLPRGWNSFLFRVEFRGRVIEVLAGKDEVQITLKSGPPVDISLYGSRHRLASQISVAADTPRRPPPPQAAPSQAPDQ